MARNKQASKLERQRILREMLEDRRQEIRDKLRSLRETLPAEAAFVRDAEEQSVADFVRDVDFALMQMKSETLAKIDEALRRLERDDYGRCEECGTEIKAARLKALPFASLCRDCQELVENTEAERRAAEARTFASQTGGLG